MADEGKGLKLDISKIKTKAALELLNKPIDLDGFNIKIKDVIGKLTDLVRNEAKLKDLDVSKAGDYQVFPPLAIQGSGEWTPSAGDAKIKLGASVGTAYTVRGYNSVDDQDDDGVIAVDGAGSAWLKHELLASAEVKFEGSAGEGVKFGVDASAAGSVRLLDYRKHDARARAGVSVMANILDARFPFRRADVLALEPGDALAFVIRGRLAFQAKVSYGWAMTAAVSALDQALGIAGVADLKVSTGVSLAVLYSVQDDYKLVFKKGEELAVLADVKKSEGTELGINGNIGIHVGFANPDQLAALVGFYLKSRLGPSLVKIKALLAEIEKATSLDELPKPLQKVAGQIAEKFGIGDPQSGFGDLKQKLAGLEAKLIEGLKGALSKKLEIHLAFSYTRIETDETLLSFEMTEARFKEHHRELLLGNLAPITERLVAKKTGFKLVKYLETKEIVEKTSFGITVSMGDWLRFGGGVETETSWKVQRNVHKHVRLSFDGRYANRVVFTAEDEMYGYELGAAMQGFALVPQGSDFVYRLALGTGWSGEHKSEKRRSIFFDKVLDDANVLGAIAPADNDRVKGELMKLKPGVEAEIELAVDDKGVRKLTAVSLDTLEEVWPRAMAASLPPVYTLDPKLRAWIGDRQRIYGRTARRLYRSTSPFDFIPDVDYSASGYHPSAQRRLKDVDDGKFESVNAFSLRTLWKPLDFRFHRGRCRQLHGWLEDLHDLRLNAVQRHVLEESFEGIRQHFRQERTYFRQISYAVVTLLREAGAGDCVTATLTVTPASGQAQVFKSDG